MKKLISIVLVVATLLTVCPIMFSSMEVSAKEELGERININSVSDLKKLSGKLNAHAVLQNDLEISASTWTPIGSIEAPFTGIFDGNGYTVTFDISVREADKTGVVAGLFGCVSGSIKRLTVEGKLSVKAASASVGTVAGCLVNGGTVFNCYSNVVTEVESTRTSSVGGIVGTVLKSPVSTQYDAEIVRCENFGVINAKVGTQNVSDGSALSRGTSGAVGGIVGFVADTACVKVSKCISGCNITIDGGKYNVAGIVGQTSTDSATTAVYITECANKGNITVNNLAGERAAGIIAYVKSGNIDYCYNTGNIIAYSDNGKTVSREGYGTHYGIFGYANLSSANKLSVQYCYNVSPNAPEAEICTVRNPSYGTFRNYCMQGREEYETQLNSNATAGKKGETFANASELASKITSACDKYIASGDDYPVLGWENDRVLPSDNEFNLYFVTREKEEQFDLRILIHTPKNHMGATLEVVFKLENGKTKKLTGNFGEQISSVQRIYCENAAYVPAQDYKLFSLILTGIDYGEWVTADVKLSANKGTYFTAQVKYADLFEQAEPSKLPIDGLPDFPAGSASAVYNAGPGMANDKSSVTDTDSEMTVIKNVKSADFTAYAASLEKEGFVCDFSNGIEDNLYRSYSKNGQNYYMYYTASSKEVRIIHDKSSNAKLSEISDKSTVKGSAEIYQYAIDYTKGTGQTSGRDKWAIDCGMCYIVKLPDNSVFLIDGGHERQTSDSAMEALDAFLHKITGTPEGQKVSIRGWYFTHAHGDHVFLAHRFFELYHQRYDLEAVYMNLPSYQTMPGGYDHGTFLMKDTVNKYYPEVTDIKLHTGQVFTLQGVKFEVFYTHEDAVNSSTGSTVISNFNDSSTVIRTTVNGKSVMFLGDIDTVAENAVCNMFGSETLKSDAVQLSHHCFNNLPNLYPKIAAALLLCPNSVENANGNNAKRQVAINAAGKEYQGILYAGSSTYKLTFNEDKIAYESIKPYWDGFFVNFPAALKVYSGGTVAQTPLDISQAVGKREISHLVYDKSASGTMGAKADEAPQTLFDGSTATKWCVTSSQTSVVTWKMKEAVSVSLYQLCTGNDTAKHSGRNPECWTLYGSADGDSWEVLDQVYSGNMSTANFTANTYKTDNSSQYIYFTLVVHNTADNGQTMQISEIKLFTEE